MGRRHLASHSTSRLKLTALYGGAWMYDALQGYGEDRPELDRRNAIIGRNHKCGSTLAGRRRYTQGDSREPRWLAPNSSQYPGRNSFRPSSVAFHTGEEDLADLTGRFFSPKSRNPDYCGSTLEIPQATFREDGMAKAPGPTQRRHVRDKATIDHLVQDVYKPKPANDKHSGHTSTTSSGLPVEDQVRKDWDPRKGGLPIF
jgi:hypothetical protein